MKLVDANLLLYATDKESARHPIARSWLQRQLSGEEPMAFARAVLLAFLRLSTSRRVFERPLSPDRAFETSRAGWAGPAR